MTGTIAETMTMLVMKSLLILLVTAPIGAAAQLAPLSVKQSASENQQGQVAGSVAGKIGERQIRSDVIGNQPSGRISSRVQNRVASRIYNRIDRYYRSYSDTASPFVEAEENARNANRRSKR